MAGAILGLSHAIVYPLKVLHYIGRHGVAMLREVCVPAALRATMTVLLLRGHILAPNAPCSRARAACHGVLCVPPPLAVDGVLDEMYGGGEGESGEEQDSDQEQDAEMMEELMQEEAESGDEQVGGGIKHGDFFDDDDDDHSRR